MPAPCPVCSDSYPSAYGRYSDEEYFTSQDEFEYWRCTRCGSVYLSPLPIAKLSQIYPYNYYSFSHREGGFVVRAKEWLDARYLRSALRLLKGGTLHVLDVGGGAGRLLNLVRSIDSRVSFTQIVDLDPNAGEQARAAGHAYTCGRIERFEADKKFHLVLLLNLIEHVESPRDVLRSVGSLLAPGGLVLIKTPNVDALDAEIFRDSYWAGLHVPRHWTLFTRDSFEAMLPGTGLCVTKFDYTQGAAFWAASLLAAWNRRGWVRISRERPTVYHPLFAPLCASFACIDFVRGMFAPTSQMRFVLARAPSA